jgi:hypothetical protein
MISQKTQFKITKNEKDYILICDSDSPLGVLHDVLCEMKGAVVQKINEVLEAEKKPESPKEDE